MLDFPHFRKKAEAEKSKAEAEKISFDPGGEVSRFRCEAPECRGALPRFPTVNGVRQIPKASNNEYSLKDAIRHVERHGEFKAVCKLFSKKGELRLGDKLASVASKYNITARLAVRKARDR